MKLEDIDLYDLDRWASEGFPADQFAFLRKHDPVHWHPKEVPGGRGYWAVTKYDDICRIGKDPMTFKSGGGTNIDDWPEEDMTAVRMLLINMDPPDHLKFRGIVKRGFTPRMIKKLEGHIVEVTREIVDKVAKRGHCDFVNDIAVHLPLEIICEQLGVPPEDRGKVIAMSNKLIGFDDPEFQNTHEDARNAAAEMVFYALQLAEEKKKNPGDDLISILLSGEIDGRELMAQEIGFFVLILAIAGNETTRNATSNGMLTLMQYPEEREKILKNMALVPSAVEEILRWAPPVIHFRRTTTKDVMIRGKHIKEGEKVVLYYGSANRDEDVFPDGHIFNVERSPNDHIAFGMGEHFCLGASLARLELQIIFRELLTRLPDMRLAAAPRRLRSNFIYGIKEMQVEFTPEK